MSNSLLDDFMLSEQGIVIQQPLTRLSFQWLDFSDPNTQKEVDKWHMHINDAKAILKDKDSLIQDLENLI